MNRVFSAGLLTMVALAFPAASVAQESSHGHGVTIGVTGGTNGLGLEAGYRFNRFVGVRANSGNFSYEKSLDADDFDVDGKARLKSLGALVDIHPFGGSFRLSVGLRSNKNRFSGVATPTGTTIEVGDDTYSSAAVDTLVGETRFRKSAPTATLGWGGSFKTGLHFGFEFGVVAQGSPKLDARSTGSLNGDPAFQASLRDQLDEWEDDARDYKYWPVLQLRLAYRF